MNVRNRVGSFLQIVGGQLGCRDKCLSFNVIELKGPPCALDGLGDVWLFEPEFLRIDHQPTDRWRDQPFHENDHHSNDGEHLRQPAQPAGRRHHGHHHAETDQCDSDTRTQGQAEMNLQPPGACHDSMLQPEHRVSHQPDPEPCCDEQGTQSLLQPLPGPWAQLQLPG